jgi:hypothetical protein
MSGGGVLLVGFGVVIFDAFAVVNMILVLSSSAYLLSIMAVRTSLYANFTRLEGRVTNCSRPDSTNRDFNWRQASNFKGTYIAYQKMG